MPPRDALPAYRRRIGVVFQDFRLIRHLSAFDNVALPLRIAGHGEEEVEGPVREMLAWVGLADRASARPPTLSGGEQQRVAIARAVIARPEMHHRRRADRQRRRGHGGAHPPPADGDEPARHHGDRRDPRSRLIAATPGPVIRLENGMLVDPTGALKHRRGAPPRRRAMSLLFISEPERRLMPSSGVRGPCRADRDHDFRDGRRRRGRAGAGRQRGGREAVSTTAIRSRSPTARRRRPRHRRRRAAPGVTRVEQVRPSELRGRSSDGSARPARGPICRCRRHHRCRPGPGADPAASAASTARCRGRGSSPIAQPGADAPGAARLTCWRCGLVLLIAVATAAAVVLAARGALDNHRATIEVMHGIGATDPR